MGPFLSLRLSYFFYFSLVGVLLPYFPLYLNRLGFRPSQIGLIMAAWPAAKLIMPIFWSNLADRLNKRNLFVQIGVVCCLFSFLGFFKVGSVWGFLAVMFIFSFFQMGLLPLVEALSMEFCLSHHKEYGHIRYWGSVGFIAGSFLFGWLIDYFSIHIILWGMLVILLFQMVAAICLPVSRTFSQQEKYSPRIFLTKPVVGFLAASLFRAISFGAYYIFFSIWLEAHGYSPAVVGFAWALASVCEVLAMVWFPRVHPRFSLKEILGTGLVLTSLRWLILATTSWLPAILLAQTLQALTFGTYHVAAVSYMSQHTPPHLRSTGQAVYASISLGLGSAIGFWGFGYLKNFVSFENLFLICSGIAALGLIFVKFLGGAEPLNRFVGKEVALDNFRNVL